MKTNEEISVIRQRLLAPFALQDMEIRAGDSWNGNATPLVYVDSRVVIQRLDTVLGLGHYSIDTPILSGMEDTVEDRKMSTKKNGVLMYCTVTITVNHPVLGTFSTSNVGEKGMDDTTGKIKTTSAWAQAFKRAASNLGIGAYLYCMALPRAAVEKNGKFTDSPNITDTAMIGALERVGFGFTCEETGKTVHWKEAANSVTRLGRVLSIDVAKAILAKE